MQDNLAMHLLISHSAPLGPQCQAAIAQLSLPNLGELLGLLTTLPPMLGSPDSLTPLSERLRANSLGLQGADGLIPWAATDAQHLGLTKVHGEAGWAWITPCHLTAKSNLVQMDDPHDLDLGTQECETLRSAMKRYFEDDGITLHPLSNGNWLAFGAIFKDLPTASLERVAGASIDNWMPQQQHAKNLRRLQNEMQMLLYTHAVNDTRTARGKPTVNAFWISGTGTPSTSPPQAAERLECDNSLRASAIRDDAYAWQQAWQELDRTRLAEVLQRVKTGKPMQLTLCGERMAVTLTRQDKPWWSRIQQHFSSSSPHQLLQVL
jgi:hypothetical protein